MPVQRSSPKWRQSLGYDKPTIHEPTLLQRWFFYKRKKVWLQRSWKRSLGEQLSEEIFWNFVVIPSRNRGSDNKSAMHQQQPSWLLCLRSQEFISSRIAEKLELHVWNSDYLVFLQIPARCARSTADTETRHWTMDKQTYTSTVSRQKAPYFDAIPPIRE